MVGGCMLARALRLAHPRAAPYNPAGFKLVHTPVHPLPRLCSRVHLCRRHLFYHARAWLSAGRKLRCQSVSDKARSYCGVALAASWFSVLTVQSDCDQVDFELLVKNKIVDQAEEQTGWERLTAMYTLDEMGGLTPELEMVANIGTTGMFVGGSMGAILSSRLAIHKFLERNQATAFESPLQAKRAMQDRVMIGMFRGFFIFGWRTAILATSFALVSTTLMVYTNKISPLHYTAAGAVAGALYKLNMGLRGMAAGGLAGSLLGVVGGTVIWLSFLLSGKTMPEIRAQQYVWKHQNALRERARMERRREKKKKDLETDLAESIGAVDGAPSPAGALLAASTGAEQGPVTAQSMGGELPRDGAVDTVSSHTVVSVVPVDTDQT